MRLRTLQKKWLISVGLASLAFLVVAISSCNVNEAVVSTTLKVQLDDSLSLGQGKYDSIRINIYDGNNRLFIDSIFHGPYVKTRDSSALANLRLGSKAPDPLKIEVLGYRNNGDISVMSMTLVHGVGSVPDVVFIPSNPKDTTLPKSIVFHVDNPLNFIVGDPGAVLLASVLPSSADQGLKWTTSNSAVAALTGMGSGKDSIQPGIAGTAILTAVSTLDNAVTASLFIVVSPKIVHPDSIDIKTSSPLALSLASLPVELFATVRPAGADPRIEWKSLSPLIVSIENGNFVRPISVGQATLVARSVEDSSVYATFSVTVQAEAILPEEMHFTNVDPLLISVGASIPLTAAIMPLGADKTILYTSDNPTIAEVSIDNQVKGRVPGTTFITAASVANAALLDTLHVTVQTAVIAPESLTLETQSPLVLILGSPSVKLKAKISPAGASQEITWIAANTSIATLENDDFAVPVAAGETEFTATSKADSKLKQTLTVKVQAAVVAAKSITLVVPDTMNLAIGSAEGALAAEVGPTGAKQDILWSIADSTIAFLTPANTVKPIKAGETIVTAKVKEDPTLTKTLVVKVIERVVADSITMEPSTLTLYSGGVTDNVTVVLKSKNAGAKYTLSSSAPLIASVKTDGTVTGIKAGKAIISASPVGDSTLVASCSVEVITDVPVIGLSPSQDTSIAYGAQLTFKVSVTQAYGTVAEIKADLDGNGAYDSTAYGKTAATFTAKYLTVSTVNTKFEVKDGEGNVTSLTRKITVNPPSVPEITITDPGGPITIRTTSYTVKFSVKDPATGLTTNVDSLVTGLVAGPNTIVVTRTNAGGQGKASVAITVDTSPPRAPKFFGNTTTRGKVRPDFGTYFNQITPENETKWGSVERIRNVMSWNSVDSIANYAQSAGIPWIFHPLIWGSQNPTWLDALSQAEQLTEVTEWMDAAKTRYPNLPMINVVYEAAPGHAPAPFAAALGGNGATGYDWILKAFTMARARWPNALLIYNDFNNLEYSATLDWTLSLVAAAKQANVPIDAIGCEAHSMSAMNVDSLKSHLDKLAATGLPIVITEYDIAKTNDSVQVAIIKEQFPILWQHPAVIGVTYWGYLEGATWVTGSGLLTSAGAERLSMTWLKTYVAENPTPPNNFPNLVK